MVETVVFSGDLILKVDASGDIVVVGWESKATFVVVSASFAFGCAGLVIAIVFFVLFLDNTV